MEEKKRRERWERLKKIKSRKGELTESRRNERMEIKVIEQWKNKWKIGTKKRGGERDENRKEKKTMKWWIQWKWRKGWCERHEWKSEREETNKWLCECFTYVASMTTPTPVGCRASVIATAICLVNLSWTVRRTETQTWTNKQNKQRRGSTDSQETKKHWTLNNMGVISFFSLIPCSLRL